VFTGKWARWGFERGLHVSQEDCRRDGPHSYDVVTNDAALVNSIEDRLMSLSDHLTSSKVFTADVHEVSIVGKGPRESRSIRCVPRLLELANETRNDPLDMRIHPRSPHSTPTDARPPTLGISCGAPRRQLHALFGSTFWIVVCRVVQRSLIGGR
jgi:hypothetical protein